MKINIQKVTKCLTCLVTCFMVVLTAMASPAYGAVALYDPADYISEISVSGDVKTISYDFNDIPGYFRWWTGSEVVEFYGWGFSGQVEAHKNFPAVSWYPFGAYASTSGFDAALDISDILPYSDIDFSASMDVIVHLEDFHDTDYVNAVYKVEYFYYDSNMQYIGNYVTPSMTHEFDLVSTGDKYGAFWLGTIEYSGTFPAEAVYVAPYFNISFGIPSTYLPDSIMDITFQRSGFTLRVDLDTVLDNSHQMEAIKDKLEDLNNGIGDVNDKLDDIISGGNSGDSLGDATDNLDKDNDELGDVLDDYNNSADKLPSTPSDFDDVVDKDALDGAIKDANKIFDWDASGLTYMFVPMGISLSLAVLFYVVFGKD